LYHIQGDIAMPVRKVSSRGRNIIGRFPSLKMKRMISFESLIERDYIYLLDYEADVDMFEEQPLTIKYRHEGKKRSYTPDFHVLQSGQHLLVECKPQKLVNQPDNQYKFAAAKQWCTTQGWEFQVVTDEQLRSNRRLENVRLLTQFARYEISPETKGRVYAALASTSPLTIADVMIEVNPHNPTTATIPILHMAFHHELQIPLDEARITLETPIRPFHRPTQVRYR
jgi:hypothetical protein